MTPGTDPFALRGPSVRRALAAGALLGVLTMIGFLAQPTFELVNTYAGNKVLRSIAGADALRGQLLVDLLTYSVALTVAHVAFGLGSALAAIATLAGFRSSRSAGPVQWTILWHFAFLIWIVGASAVWFPRSNAGVFYTDYFSTPIAGVTVFEAYSAILLASLLLLAATVVASLVRRAPRRALQGAVSLALAAAILMVAAHGPRSAVAAADMAASKPNVIFIGIDSLRLDEMRRFGGTRGLTPNLDRMLDASVTYTDAITPISRTFPAWVSILTGRYPDRTGATINLIDRAVVNATPTLADTLRGAGYETVFATDEVRFSNIDEGYGFDQAITPRIGAADFLLGTFNDFPVSNVLANTAVGGWLFPHTYANRAAYSRYLEGTFAERLEAQLDTDTPVFLAIHLTAAHWPYIWADSPEVPKGLESPEVDFIQYSQALALADRQLGEVLALLSKKGLLRNALVVLLSDHGEALVRPNDRLIPKSVELVAGATRPIEVGTFGHGTSVLSPVQYQVLLALHGTGSAVKLLPQPGERPYPATLVDIAPTVLNALGIAPPAGMDGVDLACDCVPNAEVRVRFTETEFTMPMFIAGQINPALLASQGIEYYSVDPQSGWLELKAEKLPGIDAGRERAAVSKRHILAALPTLEGTTRFVLADRRTGEARVLMAAPEGDEEALLLWQALHAKYGHHLGSPSS